MPSLRVRQDDPGLFPAYLPGVGPKMFAAQSRWRDCGREWPYKRRIGEDTLEKEEHHGTLVLLKWADVAVPLHNY